MIESELVSASFSMIFLIRDEEYDDFDPLSVEKFENMTEGVLADETVGLSSSSSNGTSCEVYAQKTEHLVD